jgi:hypothetical protein
MGLNECPNPKNDPRGDKYSKAFKLYSFGDSGALDALLGLMGQWDWYAAKAQVLIASIYFRSGEHVACLQSLREFRRRGGNKWCTCCCDTYFLPALVLFFADKPKCALVFMQRAAIIDILPQPETAQWMALLLHWMGRFEEAVEEYKRCLELANKGWSIDKPLLNHLMSAAVQHQNARNLAWLAFEGELIYDKR